MSRQRRARQAQRAATLPAAVREHSDPRWRWTVAAIVTVAFVLRLIHLLALRDTPLFTTLVGDSLQYDTWAAGIAAGAWIGTGVFYQTPLYPYAMALVYAIAGHDPFAVRVVQALLGAGSCALVALAARRLFHPRAGLIAAVLLAVYPPAIFFDSLIQKASLDLFLTAALVLCISLALTRRQLRWLAWTGVMLGALLLNRENTRVLIPILAVWIFIEFRDRTVGARARWLAAFLGAIATVLLPVALRNYAVGGEFFISTSQLGPNFYIGNHAGASGTYESLVPERGDARYERTDAARLASEAAGRPLSASEVSDYWLHRAWEYIRSQPGDWLKLMGRKILLTLNHVEIADTESLEAHAAGSPVLKPLAWLGFGVLLPLAVFGVWQTRADWRRLWIFWIAAASLLFAVALFFVFARYRAIVVPIAAIAAAPGIADLLARRQEALRGALPGVVLAAVAAVVAWLPIAPRTDATEFSLGVELLSQKKYAEALPWLEAAARVSPSNSTVHFNLGRALTENGRLDAAIAELQRAVTIEPGFTVAHHALSVALTADGQGTEALVHAQLAVRQRPEAAEYHSNLGVVLWMLERRDEAVAEFEEACRRNPSDPVSQNNLATALQQLDRFAPAIDAYETALRLRPDYAEAHGNLAMALAATGRAKDALAHFDKALTLQPKSFGMRVNYGRTLAALGRRDDAIAQFEQALTLPAAPADLATVLDTLADLYTRAGRRADATAALERAKAYRGR